MTEITQNRKQSIQIMRHSTLVMTQSTLIMIQCTLNVTRKGNNKIYGTKYTIYNRISKYDLLKYLTYPKDRKQPFTIYSLFMVVSLVVMKFRAILLGGFRNYMSSLILNTNIPNWIPGGNPVSN